MNRIAAHPCGALAAVIFAALFCAAGCDRSGGSALARSQAESINETTLSLRIERVGLPHGSTERIWTHGGELRREVERPNGTLEWSGSIALTPERRQAIRATLDRFGVWRWDARYSNAYIMDGVYMTFEARVADQAVSTRMSNRGPAFGEDGVLTYSNVGLGLGEDLLRALREMFEPAAM